MYRKYTKSEIERIVKAPRSELNTISQELDRTKTAVNLVWLKYNRPAQTPALRGSAFRYLLRAAGISAEVIRSNTRLPAILTIKHLIAYILRTRNFTYDEISKLLNYKDHTTAIHAIRKTEDMMFTEPWMMPLYQSIKNKYMLLAQRGKEYETPRI